MKKPFVKERIIEQDWKIEGIKKAFPIFLIKPENETEKALIYIPGLNGNGSMIKFYNYEFANNCYLFSFDARAQGNNKNSASKFYKRYIKDIKLIIDEFKKRYPNVKQIYLCGESWGSTLAILTYKKYPNDIKGVISWNMPYNVVDVSGDKGWRKVKKSLNVLLTFLTSINTYEDAPLADCLTNNRIVKKAVVLIKNNKLNNKVPIAAWRSFKKSWKVLEKYPNLNIKYIQSKEDVMFLPKRYSKVEKMKNVTIFEKGYHILSFDDNISDQLFLEIFTFIM